MNRRELLGALLALPAVPLALLAARPRSDWWNTPQVFVIPGGIPFEVGDILSVEFDGNSVTYRVNGERMAERQIHWFAGDGWRN